jgi:hypothetical protein
MAKAAKRPPLAGSETRHGRREGEAGARVLPADWRGRSQSRRAGVPERPAVAAADRIRGDDARSSPPRATPPSTRLRG